MANLKVVSLCTRMLYSTKKPQQYFLRVFRFISGKFFPLTCIICQVLSENLNNIALLFTRTEQLLLKCHYYQNWRCSSWQDRLTPFLKGATCGNKYFQGRSHKVQARMR